MPTEWPKGNDKVLQTEKWRTKSHCVGNSLWNKLWACRKDREEGMKTCLVQMQQSVPAMTHY